MNNARDLKSFFRSKIKELHPDRGGDREEYLKFIKWYQEALEKVNQHAQVKILKNYFPSGNVFYRIEVFSIKEVALGLTKRFHFPIQEKVCPRCRGLKFFSEGEKELCSRCEGKGVLRLQKGDEILEIPCSFCKGQGYLYKEICPECLGRGRVREDVPLEIKLPFGLREGDVLFISGKPYGVTFDFYIEVTLENHPHLKLQGDHLIFEMKIPFYELLLKDYLSVETLEGPEDIPCELLRRGEPVVLSGRGPYLSQEKLWQRGDFIIYPRVTFPERIDPKFKKMVEKWVHYLEKEGKNGG